MIRRPTRSAVLIGLVSLSVLGAGCQPGANGSNTEAALRYVALGDSYTIGTSVSEAERWPNQLSERLGDEPPTLELTANLGVNGYSSADLILDELPQLAGLDPQFVTVQIGVNDVVQGVPDDQYAANLDVILDALVTAVGAMRVLCVATPDYTVTPQGAFFGSPEAERRRIVGVNDLMRRTCDARGIRFVPEIFAISEAAGSDRALVASDGLHPSGAQYRLWVDAILPAVRDLLSTTALPSPDR